MSFTHYKNEVSQAILDAVTQLQHGTGFGSVEIMLHEGQVTQIEKREKLRFSQEKSNKHTINKAD